MTSNSKVVTLRKTPKRHPCPLLRDEGGVVDVHHHLACLGVVILVDRREEFGLSLLASSGRPRGNRFARVDLERS